jgi:hypothetical protein
MGEKAQIVAVGLIVLGAVIYLVKKFFGKGGGKSPGCGKCSSGD